MDLTTLMRISIAVSEYRSLEDVLRNIVERIAEQPSVAVEDLATPPRGPLRAVPRPSRL